MGGSLSNAATAALTRAPFGFAQDAAMLGGLGSIPITGDREVDAFLHGQVADTAALTALDMGLRGQVTPRVTNWAAANPNHRLAPLARNFRPDSGLPWSSLALIGPTLSTSNYLIDELETEVLGFGTDKDGNPVPLNNGQYYTNAALEEGALGLTIGTLANLGLKNPDWPTDLANGVANLPGTIRGAVTNRATGGASSSPSQGTWTTAPAAAANVGDDVARNLGDDLAAGLTTASRTPRWVGPAGFIAPFVVPPLQQHIVRRWTQPTPEPDALTPFIDWTKTQIGEPLVEAFGSEAVTQTGAVIGDSIAGCAAGITTRANCAAGVIAGGGLAFRDKTTLGRQFTEDSLNSDPSDPVDLLGDNLFGLAGQVGNLADVAGNGLNAGLATLAAGAVPLYELVEDGQVNVGLEERLQILNEEPSMQATRDAAGNIVDTIGRNITNTQALLGHAARAGNNMLRGENGSDCAQEQDCVVVGAATPPTAGAAGALAGDDRGGPGSVVIDELVVEESAASSDPWVTPVPPAADRVVREYWQDYTQDNGLPASRLVIETDTATYVGGDGGYRVYGLDGRPVQPAAAEAVVSVAPSVVAPVVQNSPVSGGVGVAPSTTAVVAPGGAIRLRSDVTAPLCSTTVASGCIEPSSLRDENRDGVADNAGRFRAGQGIVGEGIVGEGIVGVGYVGEGRVGTGAIRLRSDVTAPLCSTTVASGCIEPSSLRDENRDGVADNAGRFRAGQAVVGEGIVGEGIVGEGIVGVGYVGEGRVGEGRVGRGPVGEAVNFLDQNVVRPVGRALDQAQRLANEQMRTTVTGSQPLDGLMGVHGVTRHRVWFMDGGRGIYNPQGQLVTTEEGNPPSQINATSLYLRGMGGGAPVRPGAPGAVPRMAPRMAPAF